MRKNRGGDAAKGYTLVEVLIFVALTSFLLVIAVTNLNASQQNTQFTQAIRSFESQLSDIINDTPTGFFPESTQQTCSITAGAVTINDGAPVTPGIGDNNVCVYLGKAIQFNASDGPADETMRVFTIAGSREGALTGLADADPTAVASRTGSADVTQEVQLPSNLEVTSIFKNTGAAYVSADERDMLVILTDIDGAALTDNGNSQSVVIGGLNVLGAGDKGDAMDAVDQLGPLASLPLDTSNDGFVVCVRFDNDDTKRASVTVGSAGSPGTFLRIDDYNVSGGCV